MERLTFKVDGLNAFSNKGIATYGGIQKDGGVIYIGSVADKLAEYEDIGPTPEQLIEIDRLYAEMCKELAEIKKNSLSGVELAQIYAELEKLKEYRHLDEQGKLLKLPCKVGDTIFIVLHNRKIDEREVVGFKMIAKGWAVEVSDWFYLFDEFGKTVFLTQGAAEAALRNMGKGEQ